jgi:hypothetical protein
MKEVFGMIKSDPWSLIKMLWTASLGAMAIWMVISSLELDFLAESKLHVSAGERSYRPYRGPKPTFELVGAEVTDDEGLQDPMKNCTTQSLPRL